MTLWVKVVDLVERRGRAGGGRAGRKGNMARGKEMAWMKGKGRKDACESKDSRVPLDAIRGNV